MSEIWFLVVPVVFLALRAVVFAGEQAERNSAARRLASRLGLEVRRDLCSLLSSEWELVGRWRDHEVTVRHWRRLKSSGKGHRQTFEEETTVEVGSVPLGLGLRFESPTARLFGGARGSMVTGDPDFDRAMVLWGDEAVTRAMLDASTRARLMATLGGSDGEVSAGLVQLSTQSTPTDAVVIAMLERAAALVAALNARPCEADELWNDGNDDPQAEVRARALLCLWRAGSPVQRARASFAAASHGDPVLRALAALMSGERERIAGIPSGELARIAALDPSWVVGALERRGAETSLVGLLDAEGASREAAVAALGRMGSARAVEGLLPLTQGLLRSREIQEHARAAIERIQARLGPVDRGGLSVVDDRAEAGRLTVAAQSGQITVVR